MYYATVIKEPCTAVYSHLPFLLQNPRQETDQLNVEAITKVIQEVAQ